MAESTVQLQWAYPLKRQSAYATENPGADISQAHPFEGADFGVHTPSLADNAALFGKGHEFATRQEILSWDTRFRRSFVATSKIIGWALAAHTGTENSYSNLGGSPSAFTHTAFPMDVVNGAGYYGSARQLPAFTLVERTSSGLLRKFPSMIVGAVEITSQIGDWAKISMDLVGSGMKTDMNPSAFTFPNVTVESAGGEGSGVLKHADITFTIGPSGSETDHSCSLRSVRFRSEYSLFEAEGYCPGSGYLVAGDASSGQIRNKLEISRRAAMLEFVIATSPTNHTFLDALKNSTEHATTIVWQGSTISGANKHKLTLRIPRVKYRMVAVGADGENLIYQVQTVIFYDATLSNLWTATTINKDGQYLVSS